MVEVLEFIFESFWHFAGTIALILCTCVGISWIVASAVPDPPTNITMTNDQFNEAINNFKKSKK